MLAYAAQIRGGATVPPFKLGDFYQTPEQREFLRVVEERIKANDEFVECFEAYTDRRKRMATLWEDYRKSNSLSYWDFLYFSIGAATTATFGDIAPNHKWVRMLVCVQVIGSIIFVGLLVSQLAAPGR